MTSANKTTLSDAIHKQISALSLYGDKLAAALRYDDAIEKYKEALRLLPPPRQNWEAATWIYVAIGDTRFKQRDFGKAFKCFVNATHCPDGIGNPYVHLRLGQCAFESDDFDTASDELARAYMSEGEDIFLEDDEKYLLFIRKVLANDLP